MLETSETCVAIVNVVASAALQQIVDLDAIARIFPNANYPSSKFPGLVFRLKKPKTATLIFRSGKMICTGGRSKRDATLAVSKVVKALMNKNLVMVRQPQTVIQNIVASASLGRPVDLDTAFLALQGAMYEPEQFPGLVYRMEYPDVVFLIFSSGRVVCVGARTEEAVYQAVNKLQQEIEEVDAMESAIRSQCRGNETEKPKYIPTHHIDLADFASPDPEGKTCTYLRGFWCHNKACDGLPCRLARLIQGTLEDGVHGCWGFHWQEGWFTADTEKTRRKFIDGLKTDLD